jgi:hypothetical protein
MVPRGIAVSTAGSSGSSPAAICTVVEALDGYRPGEFDVEMAQMASHPAAQPFYNLACNYRARKCDLTRGTATRLQ